MKSAVRLSFNVASHPVSIVSGVVTDKRGNALSSAAVQLENLNNLSIMFYITGIDGCYQFNVTV